MKKGKSNIEIPKFKIRDSVSSDRINTDMENISEISKRYFFNEQERDTVRNEHIFSEKKMPKIDEKKRDSVLKHHVFEKDSSYSQNADYNLRDTLQKDISNNENLYKNFSNLDSIQSVESTEISIKEFVKIPEENRTSVFSDDVYGVAKAIVYPNQPEIFNPYSEDSDFIHNDTVLIRRGKPLNIIGGVQYPRASAFYVESWTATTNVDVENPYYIYSLYVPAAIDADLQIPLFRTFLLERFHSYIHVYINDRRVFPFLSGDYNNNSSAVVNPELEINYIVSNGFFQLIFATNVFEGDRVTVIFNSLTKP